MIGLYGIGGVYNYGCEAIVRGTYAYIKMIDPKEQIVYFTPNYEYDQKKLKDLNIEVVDINMSARLLKKLANKILSKLKIKKRFILDDWLKIVSTVDSIYSIGGDMYTIPRRFWNADSFDYYNNLVEFSKYAEKKGKDIIIFGASIGPFGKKKKVNEYYISALKNAKHIYCREYRTLHYLYNKGLTNCSFLPDPAFLVKDFNENNKSYNKTYIGVNLSPLSLSEAFGKYNEDTLKKFTRMLELIIDETNFSVKLIPHVLSKRKNDNDLMLLSKVKGYLNNKYLDRVVIVEQDLGFVGTKACFSDCCVVASARMHCCINSLCEGVPALFISYSEKSIGMAEYFYGNHDYIVDISKIKTDLPKTINRMIREKEKLQDFLIKRISEIRKDFERI